MRINQGDPQWANLPYRDLPYTVVEEGCGLCAVSMCADLTPLDTIDYMRQFATNGNGTTWEGIDKGLDKFVGNHKRNYVSESMTPLWDELAKGKRVGIILFGKGDSPDGTVWTETGHYVQFDDYTYEDGLHWFHTQDSGWRNHTGWFAYERSMKGCIPSIVWTAKKMKNGWIKENGSWYFYKNDKKVKNAWAQDSKGLWYYLDDDGKMVKSNIVKWHGHDYYLKGNGAMASDEMIKFPKGRCYFAKDGKRLKKRWLKYDGDNYYLKENGYAATGSMTVPCKFDKDGKLVVK